VDKEPTLYTTPEAAAQLGISPNHMRNMIRTGVALPSKQIGGTWMFTTAEIERLRHRPKRSKAVSNERT
jgi:predicted site-specific integrase-resolvase